MRAVGLRRLMSDGEDMSHVCRSILGLLFASDPKVLALAQTVGCRILTAFAGDEAPPDVSQSRSKDLASWEFPRVAEDLGLSPVLVVRTLA